MKDWLIDAFFPKKCINCKYEGRHLCESCINSLFFIDARFCPFCEKAGDMFRVCEECRADANIEQVFSLLSYANPLARKIIKNFKYNYLVDIAEDLEVLFRKFFVKYGAFFDDPDFVLVPIPLSGYKLAERGFNQAEELAKVVGKILSLPVCENLLFKKTLVKSQTVVPYAERYANPEGAFYIKEKAPKSAIIVDDVFTTGSTVKEAARILHNAGTKNIRVITLARG